MYPRYELKVSEGPVWIYEGKFCSLTSLVKFATGFDETCSLSAIDSLNSKVFSNAMLRLLIKEYLYDQVLL